jgi:hypothetical protein
MPQTPHDPSPQPSKEPDVRATLAAAVGVAEAVTLTFDSAGGRPSRRATLKAVTWTDVRFVVSQADAVLLAEAAASGDECPVIVAFKLNGKEVVFFSKQPRVGLIALPSPEGPGDSESPRVADAVGVEVALPLPEQLIMTRRRQSFRIAVAREDQLQLRVWRIDDHAILRDGPPPSRSFRAELYDLSASGLRAMLWARPVAAMQLKLGQRFRLEITAGEVQMIFDARLRHPRATARDDAFAFCGFEFNQRQDDIEGRRNRQRLDNLLARLQQAAARRQSSAA